MKIAACAVAIAVAIVLTVFSEADPQLARTLMLAFVCVVLWLSELLPPFVPTMILLGGAPLLLGAFGPDYQFANVLTWAADPVLVLFFGGFVFGVTAQRHHLDVRLARFVITTSSGSSRRLVALMLLSTAVLSMWMSNVAAAAVMVAVLRPIVSARRGDDFPAKAVFLAVAAGANVGGMATPIGTGPNAIAIASATPDARITFLGWMAFAVPLTLGMLLAAYMILIFRYRVRAPFAIASIAGRPLDARARGAVALMLVGVAAWLLEPVHGVTAPIVALIVATAIFATGLLKTADLAAVDWPTLGLIGGGISLGRLLEAGGVLERVPALLELAGGSPAVQLGVFVVASALMSALMSNTATAALLIPLASVAYPMPSTAILIAMACSFGMPFVISTPPNAIVHGQAGVTAADLMWVGLPIMILGCAVLIATGPAVLAWIGFG